MPRLTKRVVINETFSRDSEEESDFQTTSIDEVRVKPKKRSKAKKRNKEKRNEKMQSKAEEPETEKETKTKNEENESIDVHVCRLLRQYEEKGHLAKLLFLCVNVVSVWVSYVAITHLDSLSSSLGCFEVKLSYREAMESCPSIECYLADTWPHVACICTYLMLTLTTLNFLCFVGHLTIQSIFLIYLNRRSICQTFSNFTSICRLRADAFTTELRFVLGTAMHRWSRSLLDAPRDGFEEESKSDSADREEGGKRMESPHTHPETSIESEAPNGSVPNDHGRGGFPLEFKFFLMGLFCFAYAFPESIGWLLGPPRHI